MLALSIARNTFLAAHAGHTRWLKLFTFDSLPGARVMKRLGIPVSDDTVLQQSKRNISALGTQELHS
jgi:hypothetical protein